MTRRGTLEAPGRRAMIRRIGMQNRPPPAIGRMFIQRLIA
jgi:hypothetical protein